MALQHKMAMRSEQRLVMTAMLRQAIGLLPLNRMEMQQAVQQEMLNNPLLEEVQDEEKEVVEDVMPEMRDDIPEYQYDERGEVEIDWENIVQDNYDDLSPKTLTDDFPSYEQTVARPDTLQEQLERQLSLSVVAEPIRRVAEQIIWNINEEGYLVADVKELSAEMGLGSLEADKALNLVQGFTPPGIAARTLQECLVMQLKNNELSMNGNSHVLDLARDLLLNGIEQISEPKYEKLAKANNVDVDDVVQAIGIIRSLDPKPGLRFSEQRVELVIPDVSVSKRGDDYEVTLNDDGLPLLRVSSLYAAMAANKVGTSPDTRKYLEEKLRAAAWFVKSIEQRKLTILKVCRSIVLFQKDFLEHGVSRLKPLVLKDVALDIAMHESTVSRVTTGKYMDTPQGVLSFKYFFPSGLESSAGESTSSVAVKETIKKIVEQENPQKPLTDQQIAEKLKQENVAIARRTVTKYRKELRISPTRKRRKIR
ncbi:MAG: RNA polymerase factor sigma-54 [Nitrospinae bacterium]|nr:RNA polymerase factor sigma-54 [Nitrospinota bacterium]